MSALNTRSAVLSIHGDDPAFGSAGLALQGVHVQGHLDGLLLRTTVQQRYRNRTGRLIETVYTFPLAHGASLLGLSVTLGDKRLSGTLIEKQQVTCSSAFFPTSRSTWGSWSQGDCSCHPAHN